MMLAGILPVPGLATLWTAWQKLNVPAPPRPWPLSLAGLGALAVNLSCAYMLARYRHHGGSLTRAAFLSARNDALANVAIHRGRVDHCFGVVLGMARPNRRTGNAAMNADAAREVWIAAREKHGAVGKSFSSTVGGNDKEVRN